MKKEIKVKGTFLHKDAAKYEEMLKSGAEIKDPVTLKDTGAFIVASVNGEDIGNVVTEGFVLPKLYTATLKGLGDEPKSFLIEVDTASAETSEDYAEEKALINSDIVPPEEVDAMIACMEANRVGPTVISRVLTERVANASEDRAPMPKTLYCDENPSRKYWLL